ncbi:hypothetical protein V5O48_009722 [Marasmius crinis-equi]|uniref:Uncharacterized protein n=1 Tax=Marasmius crinis-equi TaxID=585013 RepID=A0ABR3FAI3_9AGAR
MSSPDTINLPPPLPWPDHADEAKKAGIYIPPSGIYFRLVNYFSNHVLVSRNTGISFKAEVWHHPSSEVFEDQWFEFVHAGYGARYGLVAIKGKKSGKVLFSRGGGDPCLGHTDGDGKYNDNWFTIEPGTGKYAKTFRLYPPSTNRAIVSRLHTQPEVFNHPKDDVHSDHHWSYMFDFEDMQIDKVEYALDEGRIIRQVPVILADKVLPNKTSATQTLTLEVNERVMHTSEFRYEFGINFKVGVQFKAGIPFVGEKGDLSFGLSSSSKWTWGKSDSTEKAWRVTFTVVAPPGKTVYATAVVSHGELEVPYTIFVSSKSTGVKTETKGIWRGVSSWNLRYSPLEVDDSGDSVMHAPV